MSKNESKHVCACVRVVSSMRFAVFFWTTELAITLTIAGYYIVLTFFPSLSLSLSKLANARIQKSPPSRNGSYEHYYHHAHATLATGPIYTGFFFKVWDSLAGSVPPADKDCKCSRCERGLGRRSEAAWAKVVKPDYSVLLQPSFWLNPAPVKAATDAAQ